MANRYPTKVVIEINHKLKLNGTKDLPDCIIGYDEKGKEIKVSDLLAFFYAQNERIDMLQSKLDDLGTKYNALAAAYKANAAKTAMQLLDLEEK